MKTATILLCASLASSVLAQGQRQPVSLTSGLTNYSGAVVSPDGSWVAFLEGAKLNVTPIQRGQSLTIVNNASLTSFVWAPDSQSIYYVNGAEVLRVPRIGGAPTSIARVAGQAVRVWAVDSQSNTVFGTRIASSPRMHHVFSLSTAAGSTAVDIVSSADTLSDVCLDPSDAFLLYSAQDALRMFRLWRVDRNGQNPLDMAGPVGTFVRNVAWIDAGDRAVFTGFDASSQAQVMRADRRLRTAVPLTSAATHLRTGASVAGGWLLCEAADRLSGNGPAIMPIDGGGLVYLFTGQAYNYTGGLSMDDAGTVVVTTARQLNQWPQVWRFDLDGEMRVHPRAELGQALHLDLPAATNEVGVIFIGDRTNAPFNLPGVGWDFQLRPNFAIVAIGQGGTNPVRATLPIPLAPGLRGLRFYFQGLRWDPTAQRGEFTRYGAVTIF